VNPTNDFLLSMKDLRTYFQTSQGLGKAVDGISLSVRRGETLGIVGESGCGKSVTALSILKLIPDPPGKIVGGEILFEGRDILKLSDAELRKLRGNEISMVFQEPMTSLNPVFTIGSQISEVLTLHQRLSKRDAIQKSIEMLKTVGIPEPERRIHEYPHQLSGGMRQRVMIAIALACRPKILIADEPTTALDVTIQAQILELLLNLKKEFGSAVILITHDLGVIAETAERVVIVYAGRVVEEAETAELFHAPKHPYTQELLKSIPDIKSSGKKENRYLHEIKGIVPSIFHLPAGCKFHPRCPYVMDICREKEPDLFQNGENHTARCWLLKKEYAHGRQ
jgi:oligopeptide/dipeptide ABC transporter ATP-binding protein